MVRHSVTSSSSSGNPALWEHLSHNFGSYICIFAEKGLLSRNERNQRYAQYGVRNRAFSHRVPSVLMFRVQRAPDKNLFIYPISSGIDLFCSYTADEESLLLSLMSSCPHVLMSSCPHVSGALRLGSYMTKLPLLKLHGITMILTLCNALISCH